MSLPTSEPVPNGVPQPQPVRRRRVRRLIIPSDANERAAFLDHLARQSLPAFDFFLFSLLAGAIVAGGILLDSPTLFFLGALTTPFMAPMVGLSLSSVIGSGWFFLRTLSGILVGSLLVFITGFLAGLASYLLPGFALDQALAHAKITWIDFLILTIGMILMTLSMARSEHKPLLPSVILGYELYLPVAVAGFGLGISLSGGTSDLWPSALVTFLFYLIWAVFLGIITLWATGIRPLNLFGYIFGILIIIISLFVGFEVSGVNNPLSSGGNSPPSTVLATSTQAPFSTTTANVTRPAVTATSDLTTNFTSTIVRTPTRTLIPSMTPTETLTPAPTPVWAVVRANNGAYVRSEPGFDGKIVDGVLGGSLVQILPETAQNGGTTWVHIVTNNGITGWIVQSILETATPVPTW